MGRLVELRDLAVAYGDKVLVSGVGLDVEEGSVTAVMGPSGSGKSLTARVAMGYVDEGLRVVSGSLRYPAHGDRDWLAGVVGGSPRAHAKLRRTTRALRGGWLSYSPQAAFSALNPGRTLGRQLQLSMARREQAPADPAREIGRLLRRVGLDLDAAKALPTELSGGQCQRAALAVAMAPAPKLVLADEPETGLDPVLTRVVTELLLDVCKEEGCGLLLISHHDDTVERIADRVVRLGAHG